MELFLAILMFLTGGDLSPVQTFVTTVQGALGDLLTSLFGA